MSKIAIIAAIGRNRVLGKDNQLLWHIPDDLKRFKALTLGHPVVMGRKTFESIVAVLGKPLPGRTNVVVTREGGSYTENGWHFWDAQLEKDGVIRVSDIKGALRVAEKMPGGDEIFIGGGGQIYTEALPLTDKLHLTLIDDEKEGDTFFPAYEREFTKVISDEVHEHEGLTYRFVDLER